MNSSNVNVNTVASELLAFSNEKIDHLASMDIVEKSAIHLAALSHATTKHMAKAGPIEKAAIHLAALSHATTKHMAKADPIEKAAIHLAALSHRSGKEMAKSLQIAKAGASLTALTTSIINHKTIGSGVPLIKEDSSFTDKLIQKAHYLSKLVGSSKISQMKEIKDAWALTIRGLSNHLSELDRTNALSLLRLMSNYENMKIFRKDSAEDAALFWNNLIQKSGYTTSHAVLSCNSESNVLPSNERQALFWNKAASIIKRLRSSKMCLDESKLNLHDCDSTHLGHLRMDDRTAAVSLLKETNYIKAMDRQANTNAEKFLELFETLRLSKQLTSEDQLFATVLEGLISKWSLGKRLIGINGGKIIDFAHMTITPRQFGQHAATASTTVTVGENKDENKETFWDGVKGFFGKVWETIISPITWMQQNAKDEEKREEAEKASGTAKRILTAST